MDYEKEAVKLVDGMCCYQIVHQYDEDGEFRQRAKQCALICCEVVIANNRVLLDSQLNNDFSILGNSVDWGRIKEAIKNI